jgi:PPOX class probable F420-dependent enzyme
MSQRTLDDVSEALAQENGLVTVATRRADGRPLLSVVNAGVLGHPVTGVQVVAFVVRGSSAKRRHLAARPAVAVLARRGWQWVAVEGDAELIGPLNPHPAFDTAAVAGLLRDVFVAAGGTHDDWSEYDRVMAAEQRTAVLVTPNRIFGPG